MKYRVLSLWLAALLLCVLQIMQTRFVADMSAFMPSAPNERQQLLVDQLREGVIARLIMVGIEGGDPAMRARISGEFAKNLRKSQLFVSVQNGAAITQEHDRAYIFDNRYLLSPGVTPERYTSSGLHESCC
jgi:predicted exporter